MKLNKTLKFAFGVLIAFPMSFIVANELLANNLTERFEYELSNDKFEITVKAIQITKHVVYVTDEILFNLTKNKISKIELLNFSFNFLLERETNTSILSSFDLTVISKYFPEYTKKVSDKYNL